MLFASGKELKSMFIGSPKGDFIATGTGEGTVAVFETKSSSKVMDAKSHTFFVTKVAFTPDSKHVLSVSADYSCLVQPVKISRQRKIADTNNFTSGSKAHTIHNLCTDSYPCIFVQLHQQINTMHLSFVMCFVYHEI